MKHAHLYGLKAQLKAASNVRKLNRHERRKYAKICRLLDKIESKK